MRDLIKRTTGRHAGPREGGGAPLRERLDAARLSARHNIAGDGAGPEEAPLPLSALPRAAEDDAGHTALPTTAMPTLETNDIDAIVQAAKTSRAGTAPATPRQCLIVDDSRVIRKVSRKITEELGYTTREAENGEEALARCRAAMPDLVITDWNMPVMTGVEFVAALRKLPGAERAKVVFCTSNSGARDVHEGIAAGADDYIVKPFGESALKAKLEGLGG